MAIASPSATKPTLSQNGSSRMKYNSAPTTNPLTTTGITDASKRFFMYAMPIQLINVAIVPNKISNGEKEKQLAIRHPNVNPTI